MIIRYLPPKVDIVVYIIIHFQTFLLVKVSKKIFTPNYLRKCYNLHLGMTLD